MRPFSSKKLVKNHQYIDIPPIQAFNRQNSNFEIRKNNYNEEIFNKEIDTLKIIWEQMGVTNKYRIHFKNQVSKLSEDNRQYILENEKKSLEKLMEIFLNLKKEILSREKNINSLKNYNNMLESNISEGNVIDTTSDIFGEICTIIVNLRYNAIRIVHAISEINKTIFLNLQKWDLSLIKKNYLYDPYYLIVMKEDLLFLKNSILSRFIVMDATDIDAFLTNCATERFASLSTNKLKIPIPEDLWKAINISRHLLLQEIVLTNNRNKEIKRANEKDRYLNTESDFNGNNDFKLFIQKNLIKKQNRDLSENKNFIISKELKYKIKESGIKNYNERKNNKPLYSSINIKNKKIKINNKAKLHLFNNINSKKIVIERDELVSNVELNNLLNDEKYKNKTLIKENSQLKEENAKNKAKYSEIKNIYDKLNNKINREEEIKINAQKDINILQMKIKELSEQNEVLLEKVKNPLNNNLNQEENVKLKEKIKELEKELSEEKEENRKSKEEIKNKNKTIELKDEEILQLKKEIEELKSKIGGKMKDTNKIDFYKGNITNFVELISDKIQLNNIPDFIKRAFLIDESIYSDNFYFKGIFPKLIISKTAEENNINGICSLSYENNENLSKNLILKINCIFSLENLENNFELMINFIKENMEFNKLVVYLLYDKIDNKFLSNKGANKIFQKKLGFKWLCVVRDEEKDQRYIKLYYTKEINSDKNKEEQNRNNFSLENYTIITLNSEQQINFIKNQINISELNYNKYINQNSIYGLLYENPKLNIEFSNEIKKIELEEAKKKLWKFNSFEFSYNLLTEEEKQSKNISINSDNSLYKKIESLNHNNTNFKCNLQKRNISINFETNYSLLIDDIYYNRISSEKIKVLKEKKTNSLFFLIPSIDNTVFFYVSQINNELLNLLIDSKENVYEQFLEFQPSTQKELFNFSVSSVRDISYIPQKINKEQKIIYIPSFIIKTHLYSYDFREISKNLKIRDLESNEELFLSSIDEYINIEFKPDNNIKNSFTVIPIEDKTKYKIIKDSFIIGIFANDIINEKKLPLIQFLYVTKEHFLTKENYNPSN